MPTIGRNDPCRCGSNKKYKKCCEEKDLLKSHTENEKLWTKAEKDFEKQKKQNPSDASPGSAVPPPASTHGKPMPGSSAHASRHSTIPAPKFNMPRKTGGG